MKYWKEIESEIQIKDIEEADITILETRKADVRRSISIVEESGTDSEDETSQRKLHA